jgi:hypothetical protein
MEAHFGGELFPLPRIAMRDPHMDAMVERGFSEYLLELHDPALPSSSSELPI